MNLVRLLTLTVTAPAVGLLITSSAVAEPVAVGVRIQGLTAKKLLMGMVRAQQSGNSVYSVTIQGEFYNVDGPNLHCTVPQKNFAADEVLENVECLYGDGIGATTKP
jgi:hypothetical protein